MKVNTDGVLLGACSTIKKTDRNILDVGTGTGCIALMLAQRYSDAGVSSFGITGIDIDGISSAEAKENFIKSPWAVHLDSINMALQDYCPPTGFDLIVSNPPYFKNDLRAPDCRRDVSRHADDSLSYEELLEFAQKYLSEKGRIAVILPASVELPLLRAAGGRSLYAFKILKIRTTPAKEHSRIIVEFGRERKTPSIETLTIQENGKYTSEYISRVSEFYLFA